MMQFFHWYTPADVVFNHKLGADDSEEVKATSFNPENRHEAIVGTASY